MKVIVLPYDERWPALFQQAAAQLRQCFGNAAAEIHHIGSTAVPGLPAKPIIDIMPVVNEIQAVDRFNGAMAANGYEPMGEYGVPGRRYFRKGGDIRTHHVHVFQANDPHIARHLAFRDYLRAFPAIAKEYGELKAALAQAYPDDMESYMNGKDGFIKETERQALAWYRQVNGEGGHWAR